MSKNALILILVGGLGIYFYYNSRNKYYDRLKKIYDKKGDVAIISEGELKKKIQDEKLESFTVPPEYPEYSGALMGAKINDTNIIVNEEFLKNITSGIKDEGDFDIILKKFNLTEVK